MEKTKGKGFESPQKIQPQPGLNEAEHRRKSTGKEDEPSLERSSSKDNGTVCTWSDLGSKTTEGDRIGAKEQDTNEKEADHSDTHNYNPRIRIKDYHSINDCLLWLRKMVDRVKQDKDLGSLVEIEFIEAIHIGHYQKMNENAFSWQEIEKDGRPKEVETNRAGPQSFCYLSQVSELLNGTYEFLGDLDKELINSSTLYQHIFPLSLLSEYFKHPTPTTNDSHAVTVSVYLSHMFAMFYIHHLSYDTRHLRKINTLSINLLDPIHRTDIREANRLDRAFRAKYFSSEFDLKDVVYDLINLHFLQNPPIDRKCTERVSVTLKLTTLRILLHSLELGVWSGHDLLLLLPVFVETIENLVLEERVINGSSVLKKTYSKYNQRCKETVAAISVQFIFLVNDEALMDKTSPKWSGAFFKRTSLATALFNILCNYVLFTENYTKVFNEKEKQQKALLRPPMTNLLVLTLTQAENDPYEQTLKDSPHFLPISEKLPEHPLSQDEANIRDQLRSLYESFGVNGNLESTQRSIKAILERCNQVKPDCQTARSNLVPCLLGLATAACQFELKGIVGPVVDLLIKWSRAHPWIKQQLLQSSSFFHLRHLFLHRVFEFSRLLFEIFKDSDFSLVYQSPMLRELISFGFNFGGEIEKYEPKCVKNISEIQVLQFVRFLTKMISKKNQKYDDYGFVLLLQSKMRTFKEKCSPFREIPELDAPYSPILFREDYGKLGVRLEEEISTDNVGQSLKLEGAVICYKFIVNLFSGGSANCSSEDLRSYIRPYHHFFQKDEAQKLLGSIKDNPEVRIDLIATNAFTSLELFGGPEMDSKLSPYVYVSKKEPDFRTETLYPGVGGEIEENSEALEDKDFEEVMRILKYAESLVQGKTKGTLSNTSKKFLYKGVFPMLTKLMNGWLMNPHLIKVSYEQLKERLNKIYESYLRISSIEDKQASPEKYEDSKDLMAKILQVFSGGAQVDDNYERHLDLDEFNSQVMLECRRLMNQLLVRVKASYRMLLVEADASAESDPVRYIANHEKHTILNRREGFSMEMIASMKSRPTLLIDKHKDHASTYSQKGPLKKESQDTKKHQVTANELATSYQIAKVDSFAAPCAENLYCQILSKNRNVKYFFYYFSGYILVEAANLDEEDCFPFLIETSHTVRNMTPFLENILYQSKDLKLKLFDVWMNTKLEEEPCFTAIKNLLLFSLLYYSKRLFLTNFIGESWMRSWKIMFQIGGFLKTLCEGNCYEFSILLANTSIWADGSKKNFYGLLITSILWMLNNSDVSEGTDPFMTLKDRSEIFVVIDVLTKIATEFVSGPCVENQMIAMNNDLTPILNVIRRDIYDIRSNFYVLRDSFIDFLISLTEGTSAKIIDSMANMVVPTELFVQIVSGVKKAFCFSKKLTSIDLKEIKEEGGKRTDEKRINYLTKEEENSHYVINPKMLKRFDHEDRMDVTNFYRHYLKSQSFSDNIIFRGVVKIYELVQHISNYNKGFGTAINSRRIKVKSMVLSIENEGKPPVGDQVVSWGNIAVHESEGFKHGSQNQEGDNSDKTDVNRIFFFLYSITVTLEVKDVETKKTELVSFVETPVMILIGRVLIRTDLFPEEMIDNILDTYENLNRDGLYKLRHYRMYEELINLSRESYYKFLCVLLLFFTGLVNLIHLVQYEPKDSQTYDTDSGTMLKGYSLVFEGSTVVLDIMLLLLWSFFKYPCLLLNIPPPKKNTVFARIGRYLMPIVKDSIKAPIYLSLQFILGLMAIFLHPYFASLQLLLMAFLFERQQYVVKAIYNNRKMLLYTIFIMILLIFPYTIFVMENFRNQLSINKPDGKVRVCIEIWECLSYVLNAGLRAGGGIGDIMDPINPHDDVFKLVVHFLTGMSFFLLINIISLSVIFGIIVDSFAAQRDKDNEMSTPEANFRTGH